MAAATGRCWSIRAGSWTRSTASGTAIRSRSRAATWRRVARKIARWPRTSRPTEEGEDTHAQDHESHARLLARSDGRAGARMPDRRPGEEIGFRDGQAVRQRDHVSGRRLADQDARG